MRRRLITALALALLVVASGCAGLSSLAGSPSDGMERSPTGPGERHCSEHSVAYDVALPAKPTPLNESSARTVARAYERRYVLARLRADHENVSVDSATFREVDVRRVDGGYEVAVTFAVHYSTDRLTAKAGYPTTYRLTDRRFIRGGRTLRCWA